jgi:4-methylaminobutanoate oxidase (formaldehyde-forming)
MVTEPMAGVTPDLPVLRDPDGYIYVREEVAVCSGRFRAAAKPWGMAIPADFPHAVRTVRSKPRSSWSRR